MSNFLIEAGVLSWMYQQFNENLIYAQQHCAIGFPPNISAFQRFSAQNWYCVYFVESAIIAHINKDLLLLQSYDRDTCIHLLLRNMPTGVNTLGEGRISQGGGVFRGMGGGVFPEEGEFSRIILNRYGWQRCMHTGFYHKFVVITSHK